LGWRLWGQFSSSSGLIDSYFVIQPSGSSFEVPPDATHLLLVIGRTSGFPDNLNEDNCGEVTATIIKQ
jgi:hypothetical protein